MDFFPEENFAQGFSELMSTMHLKQYFSLSDLLNET